MTVERPSLDALRIDREPEAARPQLSWFWIALVLVLALGATSVWWSMNAGDLPRVRTVQVLESRGGLTATTLDASGYVTARRQATVSSKITGKIAEVLVEEGMEVAEGEVLARLDGASQRAALRLAEANLEAARSTLAETEARLAKARLDLARIERLVSEAIIPQERLDTVRTEVSILEARLALENERVNVAQREVALRQIALAETVIRAPFAGVAISKNAQPGEMISPISAGGGFTRTGVCTLVDMSSLEIEVDVGEAYIQRVHPGQPVDAVIDAYPDWQIPGRVITTIPAANRQKATVTVRIALDELDPRILPDMGVKVSFLAGEAGTDAELQVPPASFSIPRSAIHDIHGDARVWVLVDGRVQQRRVKLGTVKGDRGHVLAGLAAEDLVVIWSSEGLTEDQQVDVEIES